MAYLEYEEIEKKVKELMELLQTHRPHIPLVEERIDNLGNGILTVQYRVYKNRVTDVVITRAERVTFDKK